MYVLIYAEALTAVQIYPVEVMTYMGIYIHLIMWMQLQHSMNGADILTHKLFWVESRLRCKIFLSKQYDFHRMYVSSVLVAFKSDLVSLIIEHMMTSSNGNIFRVTGPWCWEFIGHRWIPHTKANDAELLMLSVICTWIDGWVNNHEAGDLRSHQANYDVHCNETNARYHISTLHPIWF